MNRRWILALLVSAPYAAAAQTRQRMYRIGYIVTATPDEQQHLTKVLREGLLQLGYVEGRDFVLESRFAAGRQERLDPLAKELVDLNVDVIVTGGNPVIAAVKRSTSSIPVVMAASRDPVVSGFVKSLSHPGGNITGLTNDPAPEIFTKNLGLLKELLPAAARVGLLWNPQSPGATTYQALTSNAAREMQISLRSVEARGRDQFDQAFATIASGGADALVVQPDPIFFTARDQIVSLASRYKLPAVYHAREFAEVGGLMSYGANLADQFRRAATFVDKILKGAKAADIPIEAATRFEFAINLKTAKALGLTVPPTLLARADEVIE